MFSLKNKEDSQKSVQFANLGFFLWIVLEILRKNHHKNAPKSRTSLPIGLSLLWFAGATPENNLKILFGRFFGGREE